MQDVNNRENSPEERDMGTLSIITQFFYKLTTGLNNTIY